MLRLHSAFLTALALSVGLSSGLSGCSPLPGDRRPASTTPKAALKPLEGEDCYRLVAKLMVERLTADDTPIFLYADGTEVPISRAFEKEGLLYSDIQKWFDAVDPIAFEKRLRDRLAKEASGQIRPKLTDWFSQWRSASKYRTLHINKFPEDFLNKTDELLASESLKDRAAGAAEILDFMLKRENPFELISVEGREDLFYQGFLNFDDVRRSDRTPAFLTVGDDLGSYEVRTIAGEADFNKFTKQVAVVEDHLESSIGHQHLVHRWPDNEKARAEMAPGYIDLLDTGTWWLFWRQAKRDPEDFESILAHPYLGVYNQDALRKLKNAVVAGDYDAFNNKYRMIGARRLPGDPNIPGQKDKMMADWELRSGNKSAKRAFTEDVLAARLSTGDYRGMKGFGTYDFDASAPIEELMSGLIPEEGMRVLKEFEKRFPYMNWSGRSDAYNHFRNKFVSPLLPWQNRLNLGAKAKVLKAEQKRFAEGLRDIAVKYVGEERQVRFRKDRTALIELRQKTEAELEALVFDFADRVRLDEELERLIAPASPRSPSILVKPSGPIDVNEVGLGIEYSFRFPSPPQNRALAEEQIRRAAEAFRDRMGGGTVKKKEDGGHGHGLSVRYIYTDLQGRDWRVEWDGIKRSYRDQKAYHSRGGHIEVPTPKFYPKDMKDMEALYGAMRENNFFPRRSAGGAHVNVDLSMLQKLPEKQGAKLMANLISLFESNREMTAALWQHPFRQRTGIPVEIDSDFIYKLNEFNGDWQELGELLYKSKYFNTYVSRKPGYTQLNVMALMQDVIPEEFTQTIDIKKPGKRWFPAFGGKGGDRIEWRLFDAPEDEYVAALQIKYVRAILDKAWNSTEPVRLSRRYSPEHVALWKSRPEEFVRASEEHLKELGLDFQEFLPAIRESVEIQQIIPKEKPLPRKYTGFRERVSLDPQESAIGNRAHLAEARLADLKREVKGFVPLRERFSKRPSERNLLHVMESYDWSVRRLRSLLVNEGQLVTRGMDSKQIAELDKAIGEIERFQPMSRPEIGRWVGVKRRKEYGVVIQNFEKSQADAKLVVERLRILIKSR